MLNLILKALLPDSVDFRFGIQKCKKTIDDTVKDITVFEFEGVENLFQILRKQIDIQDRNQFMSTYVSLNY